MNWYNYSIAVNFRYNQMAFRKCWDKYFILYMLILQFTYFLHNLNSYTHKYENGNEKYV